MGSEEFSKIGMEFWTRIKNCGGRRWVVPVQICHGKPAAMAGKQRTSRMTANSMNWGWERVMTANSMNFTHLPIWVQVWGLPLDLFSEGVGTDIGKGLGRVVEVDLKALASDQARFLQIHVEIRLDIPVCRGSKVQGPKGG